MRRKLLLLEDNDERIAAFRSAVAELGEDWQLQIWRDAPTMLAQCEECFEETALISLDHDLNPQPGTVGDPGTGLEVARFLAGNLPLCPVIIHSSNTDRAWSMHNELRFGGWQVDRVGPIGEDWIREFWLPKVREFLAAQSQSAILFQKSNGHAERMQRALISLEGLAIGDAVGEMLAYRHSDAARIIKAGLPAGPWFHTDDTEMALSIVDVLRLHGHIQQHALARRFAWRFEQDPDRGYGKMTRIQMQELMRGADWQQTAAAAFGGQGSMGNGGAMRVAPLGAYYADDLERVVHEARASSMVTHIHPEAIAGTIAVAVAAAMAWQLRDKPENRESGMFEEILRFTPESQVRRGIALAAETPSTLPVEAVAKALGNGSLVTAPDTVPFALWCGTHHLDDYVNALCSTIEGGGDCDTNAAIVGGIVVMAAGLQGIPTEWRDAKEKLFYPG